MNLRLLIVVALLACLLGGCAVKLMGDYDNVIDRGITDFYERAEVHLMKLEREHGTAGAAYRNNIGFYDQAEATLSTLRVRASATPKKGILVRHIDLLRSTFDELKAVHARSGDKGPLPSVLGPTRSAIATQVEAILKLELSLKRRAGNPKL